MITTITRQVVKRCPYVDEDDAGELVIVFNGDAPELYDLAARIDKLAAEPVSHEDYTRQVAALIPAAQVTTRWHTGPWAVEVAEGAVLRDPVNTAGA